MTTTARIGLYGAALALTFTSSHGLCGRGSPVDGRFSDQACIAGVVEADLLGDLVGVDEVLALEGECGHAAALQAGGVISW
jgi:hypothetical protein